MTKVLSNPLRALIGAALIATGSPALAEPWSNDSVAMGRQEHANVLETYGGEMTDRALTAYVSSIGRDLASRTDRADATWTFTILDTPVVNAFAVPGGYVYVTRGLLALANDEAELAGVLGHEIGHLVEGHNEERMRRSNTAGIGVIAGAILGGLLGGSDGAGDAIRIGAGLAQGWLSSYSQKQELAADAFGVDLLARAGYDPYAQADFLGQLSRSERLQSRIAGQSYNPNRVEIFATHPANADRIARATRLAERTGQPRGAGRVAEAAYLDHLQGMVFGDVAEQGFIRGQTFSHPSMRFTFTAPDGFILENSPVAVTASKPGGGGRIILSGDAPWRGDLRAYVERRWLPMLAQEVRLERVDRVETLTLNGIEAARTHLTFTGPEGPGVADIIALRHAGHTIRLAGLSPAGANDTARQISAALDRFRPLSRAQAARLHPFTLSIHTVRDGESATALAEDMALPTYRLDQFLTLNGYESPDDMHPGDLVKLVE